MKSIRMPARPGCFAAIAAAAILAFAMQAECADADSPIGTWIGHVRDITKDGKNTSELLQPVEFDWIDKDFRKPTSTLRYFGKRSCTLQAQYLGQEGNRHQFTLKAPPGGHCDKAGHAFLDPQEDGLHLTVESEDGKSLREAGVLTLAPPASAPAAH